MAIKVRLREAMDGGGRGGAGGGVGAEAVVGLDEDAVAELGLVGKQDAAVHVARRSPSAPRVKPAAEAGVWCHVHLGRGSVIEVAVRGDDDGVEAGLGLGLRLRRSAMRCPGEADARPRCGTRPRS